jgi:outer membrane protein assembly factor BamE (lipoprotein component of BamABCDE complex)
MKCFRRLGAALLAMTLLAACSKDEKSSAERDKEVQKALQEGTQREQKMYEGMQKGVEGMEKKATDEKEATKK